MLSKQLLNLFCSFKHHVLSHHPKEILTLDNFLQLRKEVVVGTSELNPEGEGVGDDGPPGEVGPPGEDAPPGMEIEGEKVCIDLLFGEIFFIRMITT